MYALCDRSKGKKFKNGRLGHYRLDTGSLVFLLSGSKYQPGGLCFPSSQPSIGPRLSRSRFFCESAAGYGT